MSPDGVELWLEGISTAETVLSVRSLIAEQPKTAHYTAYSLVLRPSKETAEQVTLAAEQATAAMAAAGGGAVGGWAPLQVGPGLVENRAHSQALAGSLASSVTNGPDIIELNDVAELSEYYGAGLVDGATIYMVRTVYDLRAARYHLRRFRELLSSPPSALEALPPKPIETDRIVEEARVLAEAKAAKAKAEADRSGLAAGTETEAVAETNGGDGADAAKSSSDETAAAQQQVTPAQIKERQEAQLAEQNKLTNRITSRMPKMEPLPLPAGSAMNTKDALALVQSAAQDSDPFDANSGYAGYSTAEVAAMTSAVSEGTVDPAVALLMNERGPDRGEEEMGMAGLTCGLGQGYGLDLFFPKVLGPAALDLKPQLSSDQWKMAAEAGEGEAGQAGDAGRT
eukprot:CAMPEP_0119503426 /NCGR_PEP_ID=MMETSP1344-20130328/24600_1 /TAXON_ID=236787 /ORGANISM="Florenciella parvula, Strain CCMP2471" /LENGTH=397 /DNA_ID=CAMNT_0007539719 /DNA_START=19 /DNA_END=1208 /DNA_ORIENTATION=+